MRLLVETCTFLWLATDEAKHSARARKTCRARAKVVYLSALSAREIAIKRRLGRLPLPLPPSAYVASRRDWLGLERLPFGESSAACDADLPPLHRNPIDRGLVSQATLHGLTIVTPDPDIRAYPVPTLW